jgi:uncharacterized protein YndB with AHSA1/START domain
MRVMSVARIEVLATRERVFAVLGEPERYADWVVGTRAVRDADESFPERGSRFSARVGTGPATLDAVTTVLEHEEPRRLVLRTRLRRLGAAQIDLELEERGAATVVTMRERAVGDPISRFAQSLGEPLVTARNRRSLQRLKQLVERGA